MDRKVDDVIHYLAPVCKVRGGIVHWALHGQAQVALGARARDGRFGQGRQHVHVKPRINPETYGSWCELSTLKRMVLLFLKRAKKALSQMLKFSSLGSVKIPIFELGILVVGQEARHVATLRRHHPAPFLVVTANENRVLVEVSGSVV
jgi:hypothetical protein